MSNKKTNKKTAVPQSNCRGADLASTSRQRFREEVLAKESLSRLKLYMDIKEARKDNEESSSKQCEVLKARVERSMPKPQQNLLDLAEKYSSMHIEHQHKIKKVDIERVPVVVLSEIEPSKKLLFHTSSNSEYGWWAGAGADNSVGEMARSGTRGRKNVIRETFYRRNGVGECMAV